MMTGRSLPRDWTLGTGVIPSGGTITVSAEPDRQSIFIQNIGSGTSHLVLPATEPGTGPADTGDTFETSTTVTITLLPGTTNSYGRNVISLSTQNGLFTTAAFSVTGTAGQAIAVLTN